MTIVSRLQHYTLYTAVLTHLLVCGPQADCGIQTLLENIRECDAQTDTIFEEADGAVDAVPQRSDDITCQRSGVLRATAMWHRLRDILHWIDPTLWHRPQLLADMPVV